MGLARTIYYCLKIRHNEKLTPQQVQALQTDSLRKSVRFAKKHSPFFSDYYRHVDPDSESFSIRSLPPVTKDILMENFDRVVTDPALKLAEVKSWVQDQSNIGRLYRGRFVVTHTSGTTGAPGFFLYNMKEWDWIRALAVTRGVRFKPSFIDFFRKAGRILVHKVRVALVSVLRGHFVTYVLFLLTPKITRVGSKFYYLSVVDPIARLVEQLNQIRPNLIHCYPTMLEMLAYEQMEGRLNIEPWLISSSSEPLTLSARQIIQKAFPNSEVYETYGTSEGVALASECPYHNGMHLNTDYFLVESVREDGSPVEPGEGGYKLYLSCLFCRTMPLLRYEINDVTTPLAEACSCGLPFPLIKVQGRTDDTFWVYDRHQKPVALPPIPFEALFLDVEGLKQYQLVQEERNRLRVSFRPNVGMEPAQVAVQIRSKLVGYLSDKQVDDCVDLEIRAVDEIERDPACGKIRQIHSKVERLYLPGQPLGERRSGEDRRSFLKPDISDRRQQKRRADDTKAPEDS